MKHISLHSYLIKRESKSILNHNDNLDNYKSTTYDLKRSNQRATVIDQTGGKNISSVNKFYNTINYVIE